MRMSISDPFLNWTRFSDELNHRISKAFLTPRPTQTARNHPWESRVSVHETADEILLAVDVPGVAPESIELTAENNVLTVKGRRTSRQAEVEAASEQEVERKHGICTRSFLMPENIDTDRIDARAEHGVLEISMPKASNSPRIKIPVKSKEV